MPPMGDNFDAMVEPRKILTDLRQGGGHVGGGNITTADVSAYRGDDLNSGDPSYIEVMPKCRTYSVSACQRARSPKRISCDRHSSLTERSHRFAYAFKLDGRGGVGHR